MGPQPVGVHTYGFGVTTWVYWQGLASMVADKKPTVGKLTLAVTAGLGFGALNEVLEFAATLLFKNTNVGGYMNTGWDLVANLIGALAAALLIRLEYKKRRSSGRASGEGIRLIRY